MAKRNSRLPSIHPKADGPDRLDSMDEVLASCRKIRVLAELLFRSNTSSLNPATVATTGALILEEIKKLRKGLDCLQRKG